MVLTYPTIAIGLQNALVEQQGEGFFAIIENFLMEVTAGRIDTGRNEHYLDSQRDLPL